MQKSAEARIGSVDELINGAGEVGAAVSRLTSIEEILAGVLPAAQDRLALNEGVTFPELEGILAGDDSLRGLTAQYLQDLKNLRAEARAILHKGTEHLIGQRVCFIGYHAVWSSVTEGKDLFEVRKTPDNGYGYGFLDDLSVRGIDTVGVRKFRCGPVLTLGNVTLTGANGSSVSPDCFLPCSQDLSDLVVSESNERIEAVAEVIFGKVDLA